MLIRSSIFIRSTSIIRLQELRVFEILHFFILNQRFQLKLQIVNVCLFGWSVFLSIKHFVSKRQQESLIYFILHVLVLSLK